MKPAAQGGTLNVLSEAAVERIHSASLSILANYGVFSESDLILDIFARSGAIVDRESRRIRIPPEIVISALQTAPSSFTFYGRDPQYDLNLQQGPVYFGSGGSSEPFIWDYSLGTPRSPTKADMVACTRIGQAARHIDFVMALCSARDYPSEQIFLHEYDALIRNTQKPILYSCPDRWHTQVFIEMAAAACGGEDEFRRRPPVMFFNTGISPLRIGTFSEGMVDAIQWGVPVTICLGPMMGATSPATLAGTLAQINAEALFGIVFAQVIQPGAKVVYGPHVAVMDMSTAQCTYGSAEQTLGRAAVAQMGRYYNLPTFGLGGGVEAKLPDAEASAQAMMGMFANAQSGLTLTQCLGTLASGLYGSPEMLLICDEMVHMIKRFLARHPGQRRELSPWMSSRNWDPAATTSPTITPPSGSARSSSSPSSSAASPSIPGWRAAPARSSTSPTSASRRCSPRAHPHCCPPAPTRSWSASSAAASKPLRDASPPPDLECPRRIPCPPTHPTSTVF